MTKHRLHQPMMRVTSQQMTNKHPSLSRTSKPGIPIRMINLAAVVSLSVEGMERSMPGCLPICFCHLLCSSPLVFICWCRSHPTPLLPPPLFPLTPPLSSSCAFIVRFVTVIYCAVSILFLCHFLWSITIFYLSHVAVGFCCSVMLLVSFLFVFCCCFFSDYALAGVMISV